MYGEPRNPNLGDVPTHNDRKTDDMRKRTLFLIAALATVLAVAFGSTASAVHLLTSKDVKDHSLKVKDLRKNAVKKLRGQTGPQGLQGLPGKNGVDGKNGVNGKDGRDGVDGKDGASAAEAAHTVTVTGSLGVGITSVTAACAPTESVLGGGYSVGIANKDATAVVLDNKPTSGDNGWTVRGYKVDAPGSGVGSLPVTVYAICAA